MRAIGSLGLVLAFCTAAAAAPGGRLVPTGQAITPEAAPGAVFQSLDPELAGAPGFTAGQASALALSPDGRTLLILTSGYNRNVGPDGKTVPELSNEYVFVYDVSGARPVKRQVLQVKNSFLGLAWAPAGDKFYVSGGVDDQVIEFARGPDGFERGRSFALGHKAGLGLLVKPEAAGLAVSPDGRRLLVANYQNDSVSLIDLGSGAASELDLRPGAHDGSRRGAPGGTFPRAVAFVSDDKAYVGSERDREIIALSLAPRGLAIAARIRVRGQPTALIAGRGGRRLYATVDDTDAALAIDPVRDRVIETIPTAAPDALLGRARSLGGANANALALSPDQRTLLVSNGGENAIAVIRLDPRASGLASPRPAHRNDDDDARAKQHSSVVGLIPTGWYPTGVAMRPDGRGIYAVNGKSPPGPDPGACRNVLAHARDAENPCRAANQYVWQLEKAGFLALPTPGQAALGQMTRQAALDIGLIRRDDAARADAVMAELHRRIRHVIFIVKENRTYDQVLGDLEVGNGDPRLALFGRTITPNQHALARRFVDLDAFYDTGESSNTGWDWTTAARTNDFTEREAPVNYADRGLQYDQEGTNRQVNVAAGSLEARKAFNPLTPDDPDILAGRADVAALDGPDGEPGAGYIWDAALRAGLGVRNWGFFGDLGRYDREAGAARIPLEREPWKTGLRVFFPANAALMDRSDPYFRGFDQAFPDFWRYREWERDFDGLVRTGKAPALILVRLNHDHTGDFDEAIDGLGSVESEVADNDYAVGLLVQHVAEGPLAKDTLIFVVEDDAQDGPDHVDAHRSIAFVAGPWVKQGAVVSHRYSTVSLVRTMEAVLGLGPLNLNDALAEPMADVFDLAGDGGWSFKATVPAVLRSSSLPLPAPSPQAAACVVRPARSPAYWARVMAGQDFSQEDRLDTPAYNLALWRGLKGQTPYPVSRPGTDLSQGRAARLAAAHVPGCS